MKPEKPPTREELLAWRIIALMDKEDLSVRATPYLALQAKLAAAIFEFRDSHGEPTGEPAW